MDRRHTTYAVLAAVIAAAWLAGVVYLANEWLDSAVLFTTPHPDEARANAADTLRLAAGVVAGPAALTGIAYAGGLRGLARTAVIGTVVLAGLFVWPVVQAVRLVA